MAHNDTLTVHDHTVFCEGDAASGHPRVYLHIGPSGDIRCPYCSRRFVLDRSAHDGAGEGAPARA